MRTIKFRAWDRKKKVMFYITKYLDYRWFEIFFEGWNLSATSGHPNKEILTSYLDGELMQFIGVKDKEKKEIYEGDIYTLKYKMNYRKREDKCKVVFENAQFVGKCLCGCNQDRQIHNSKKFKVEIIGNIYENPELLRKVQITKERKKSK